MGDWNQRGLFRCGHTSAALSNRSRIRIAELLPVSDKTVSTYKAQILETRQLKT
jgi:hypothetical protein